jgi:hypothetical protein
MENSYFVISVNGQKAVDAGYKFQKGACYRQIINHGKALAQLEVVVDDEGMYNGNPNKWVDVAYIKTGKDVETVLNILSKIGFKNCPCFISEVINSNTDFIDTEKELFCTII